MSYLLLYSIASAAVPRTSQPVLPSSSAPEFLSTFSEALHISGRGGREGGREEGGERGREGGKVVLKHKDCMCMTVCTYQ